MSWSVNVACVCGTSTLGMWQETQFLVATLQTVFAAVWIAFPEWQAMHLESYAVNSLTRG